MLIPPIEHTAETERARYCNCRRSFWNRIAQNPPRSWGAFYHKRLKYVYGLVIPEGVRVLEIGCGAGDLLAALRPNFGLGIDFSPEMIAKARVQHPEIHFEVMDAHELELGGQQFDFIILSDVANDLWDIQTVLENLRPCCHLGTRLVFNFFNHL